MRHMMNKIQWNKFKNVLVLAVGGGNDSVSTLLLQLQLNKSFGYSPEKIDVCCVLPDCLNYENAEQTDIDLLFKIKKDTKRFVNGKEMKAFPEPLLVENKNIFPELNVDNVYGISMSKGNKGILTVLKKLTFKNNYDLVLSIDVGGDFIACNENIEVLSPMMDGYMLFALKEFKKIVEKRNNKFKTKTEMLYSVFGLGTDGESTPEMLQKALDRVNAQEYKFNVEDIKEFSKFYREKIEPNRYSRTTDYTLLEIEGQSHQNPSMFRGRFHVPSKLESLKYYGNFEHLQSEKYYGKYYIFENLDNVLNRFSVPVSNGIEWFIHIQKKDTKINHELNGQSYDLSLITKNKEFKNKKIFFGTPSRKFNEELQKDIQNKIIENVINGNIDYAIIYNNTKIKDIESLSLNENLLLIGKNNTEKVLKLIKK